MRQATHSILNQNFFHNIYFSILLHLRSPYRSLRSSVPHMLRWLSKYIFDYAMLTRNLTNPSTTPPHGPHCPLCSQWVLLPTLHSEVPLGILLFSCCIAASPPHSYKCTVANHFLLQFFLARIVPLRSRCQTLHWVVVVQQSSSSNNDVPNFASYWGYIPSYCMTVSIKSYYVSLEWDLFNRWLTS